MAKRKCKYGRTKAGKCRKTARKAHHRRGGRKMTGGAVGALALLAAGAGAATYAVTRKG